MLIKSSNFCVHGYLVARGKETGTCPECHPRAPLKPADPCKLSSLPPETKTARCLECGLVVRKMKWGSWKAPRQPKLLICGKREHRWVAVTDREVGHGTGQQQGAHGGGVRADGEPRQGEDQDVGDDVDNGGDGQ